MTRLDVCVLGPLVVRVDGSPVDLGPRRNAALLAALALARSAPVSNPRLADFVWGEVPPPKWEGSLHSRVSRLRTALGPAAELLVTHDKGYALELAGGQLDLVDFEADGARGRALLLEGSLVAARDDLAGALARCHGSLCADLGDIDALAPYRAAFDEQRATTFEALADVRLGLGEHEALVVDLEGHVRAFPFREHGWAGLALALYRCGRQAEALRRIDELRTLLREQLGIDPGREVRDLQDEILAHDPKLDPTHGARTAPLSPAPRPRPARTTHPRWLQDPDDAFIGRERERTLIEASWAAVREGTSRVVVIEGEAGIGKTRLVTHALAALDPGAVLAGRCDEDPLLAYQPFAEALDPLMQDEEGWAELGTGAAPLALIAPDLPARFPWLTVPELVDGDAARAAAVHALHLVRARWFGTEPLVVVVDDLHWVPAPALRLLRHLVRLDAIGPALFLLTARDTEAGDVLRDTLLGWTRDRLLDVARLRPLDSGGIVALAEARGATQSIAVRATELSGGNPFYVEELVRHLLDVEGERAPEGVPETVRATVAQRLRRLPASSLPVLEAAAVAGSTFEPDLVAGAIEQRPEEVDAAVEPAVGAGLVQQVEAGSPVYGFAHAIVRDVLLDGIGGARRIRLHRRIADVLEATSPRSAVRDNELAFHATEAVSDEASARRAIEVAVAAARAEMGRFAEDEAERILAAATGRASSHLDRMDASLLSARIEHAEAVGRTGATERAMDLALGVADDALAADDLPLAGQAMLGAQRWTSVPRPELDERWRQICEEVDDPDDDLSVLGECLTANGTGSVDAVVASARAMLDRLERRPRSHRIRGLVHQTAADLIHGLVASEETTELYGVAVDEIRRSGDPLATIAYLTGARIALFASGQFEEARDLGREYERMATESRVPRYLAGMEQRRAMYAIYEGRFADGEAHARSAVEIQPTAEMFEAYALQLFETRHQQGRMDEVVDAVRNFVVSNPTPAWTVGLAMVLATQREEEEARGLLEPVLADGFDAIGRDTYGQTALVLAAEVAAILGDPDLASPLLRELDLLTHVLILSPAAVACFGTRDQYRARLHVVLGNADEAIAAFEHSLAIHERLGARPSIARDRLDLAAVLEASGTDAGRAADLRRTGSAIARELGLTINLTAS